MVQDSIKQTDNCLKLSTKSLSANEMVSIPKVKMWLNKNNPTSEARKEIDKFEQTRTYLKYNYFSFHSPTQPQDKVVNVIG